MREPMPIGEINVDEINENLKKYQETLLERRKEAYDERINRLNEASLSVFANNLNDEKHIPYLLQYDGKYAPYLLQFGFLLNILKDNNRDFDIESLQVKVDIIEQILKMKSLPSFNIECHIESKDVDKYTSIKSLIEKKIFGQRKYRLVFHKKEATFEEKYFKSNVKTKLGLLAMSEIILLLISIFAINSYILFFIVLFILLFTMFLM